MKCHIIKIGTMALLWVGLPVLAFAEYKFKPAIGGWFGPTAPLFVTADEVDGNFGGGLYGRLNPPISNFFVGIDGAWLVFKSGLDHRLDMYPVTGSMIYRLPFDLPVNIYTRAGLGASYVKILPDRKEAWDPVAIVGTEFYFPAGKYVNLGLRVDFQWTIENSITSRKRWVYQDGRYDLRDKGRYNGYSLFFGLSLYFNLVK